MKSHRLSKGLLFTCWLVTDIGFFRTSRQGILPYLLMLFVVPAVMALPSLAAWRVQRRLALTRGEIIWVGVWTKLVLFHWYVIPFVYCFEQREDWVLEVWHQLITLICQAGVVILMSRMLIQGATKGVPNGKAPEEISSA